MKKKTLVVIMVMLIFFMGCTSTLPEEPWISIELPFAVHKAGSTVSTDLRINESNRNKETDHYPFDLKFMFRKGDEQDRARVRKLAGGGGTINGQPAEPGIPILLKITIHAINTSSENPFLEKEILTKATWSEDIDSFCRKIDFIHLPLGFYHITVTSLKDIPELTGTEIKLYIHQRYRGK